MFCKLALTAPSCARYHSLTVNAPDSEVRIEAL
jgi:hypothetical protein